MPIILMEQFQHRFINSHICQFCKSSNIYSNFYTKLFKRVVGSQGGTISSEIGQLSALGSLELRGQCSGGIPAEMVNLQPLLNLYPFYLAVFSRSMCDIVI